MQAQLAKPYPPDGLWHAEDLALAAYWLNQKCDEADRALIAEHDDLFPQQPKDEESFHWHAYLLERIYFLFAHDSRHFPGRMSAKAEAALLDMLWSWAAPRCRLEMAAPEHVWWVWGSENHQAQAWSSFWGAAQIFATHPDYSNRRYNDGTLPGKMAAAFTEYYKVFCRERASKGLLIECNSGYNKYTLGGWFNIADFSEDPVLRHRMSMLLDLFWADWATEQIDGVRGGSRHRCYPGGTSTTDTSMEGLSWIFFGLAQGPSTHPNTMCAATTFWRPPAIVSQLALDPASRGVYESVMRLPGLLHQPEEGSSVTFDSAHPDSRFGKGSVHALDPQGGALLRYTYCTPDFVIGTSMVEARPTTDWAAISSQNRWEGVIFGGHPTARIFVQPRQPKKGSFYNASWSVQKHGVLIVQRLKTSKSAQGQRIWFDASLKREEHDGWFFAEAPRAFAAVHVIEGGTRWEPDTLDQHRSRNGPTNLGEWLACLDEFSPVIIEVTRKSDCPGFAGFQQSILANALHWENHRLDYTSQLNATTLTLFGDYSKVPQIDGKSIDYAPAEVYQSPFVSGRFGEGNVTIQHGSEKLLLDFTGS